MRLIVSLTSYGARINTTLPVAIKSMNSCSLYHPDKIVCYIAEEEKNTINRQLFKDFKNLEFRFIKDYKSHKKFFALTEKEFQEDIVVIADDDLQYKVYWLQKLFNKYEEHKSDKNCIICNRAQRLQDVPYKDRRFILRNDNDSGRMIFGSGAGLFIPPFVMRFDVDLIEKASTLSPHCDEQFYSLYCVKKGIRTYCTGKPQPFTPIPLPKADPLGLWDRYNKYEKDATLQKIADYFGISVSEEIFVSMTSWKKRINYACDAVRRMKNQTYRPKKIILTLSEDEFPLKEKELPENLLKERDNVFEIRWCKENTKTFKKLLPLFYIHPDYWLLTVDDDVDYPKNFIETMVQSAVDDTLPITGSHLKTDYFEFGNIISSNGAFTLVKPKHCLPYLKDMYEDLKKQELCLCSDPLLTYSVLLNGLSFRKSIVDYRGLQAKWNGRFPDAYSAGADGRMKNERTHQLFHLWCEENNITLS